MKIKISIFYPYEPRSECTKTIEVKNGLTKDEIIDYIYFNKVKILKECGWFKTLSDIEITTILESGKINIKYLE